MSTCTTARETWNRTTVESGKCAEALIRGLRSALFRENQLAWLLGTDLREGVSVALKGVGREKSWHEFMV